MQPLKLKAEVLSYLLNRKSVSKKKNDFALCSQPHTELSEAEAEQQAFINFCFSNRLSVDLPLAVCPWPLWRWVRVRERGETVKP